MLGTARLLGQSTGAALVALQQVDEAQRQVVVEVAQQRIDISVERQLALGQRVVQVDFDATAFLRFGIHRDMSVHEVRLCSSSFFVW